MPALRQRLGRVMYWLLRPAFEHHQEAEREWSRVAAKKASARSVAAAMAGAPAASELRLTQVQANRIIDATFNFAMNPSDRGVLTTAQELSEAVAWVANRLSDPPADSSPAAATPSAPPDTSGPQSRASEGSCSSGSQQPQGSPQ